MTENKEIMNEYEVQIKLHINEQLYIKGAISEEVYNRAKQLILKTC